MFCVTGSGGRESTSCQLLVAVQRHRNRALKSRLNFRVGFKKEKKKVCVVCVAMQQMILSLKFFFFEFFYLQKLLQTSVVHTAAFCWKDSVGEGCRITYYATIAMGKC